MRFWNKLLTLWRRKGLDQRLQEEFDTHIENLAERYAASGMTPGDARAAARRQLGNATLQREEAREAWTFTGVETLLKDVRHSLRLLGRSPLFTVVAVFSLAAGIGVNSVMFSFADMLIFRPLPVARPSEVLQIFSASRSARAERLSFPEYRDLRAQAESFRGIAASRLVPAGLAAQPDAPARMRLALSVSTNFFDTLEIRPAIGRGFLPGEEREPVVVLSHALWRDEFGADASIVGRSVRVSARDFQVVGVAPASFTGMDRLIREELYLPAGIADLLSSGPSDSLEKRDRRLFAVHGRLKPGVPDKQASREVAAISARLEQDYPQTNRGIRIEAVTVPEFRGRSAPDELMLSRSLLALSALVLLIACANVASLLLARATARAREFAIRMAIGAGRTRLLRQLLTESLVLSVLGGIGGVALGYAAIRLIASVRLPTDLNVSLHVQLDPRVLAFSLACCLASAFIFGFAPARLTLKSGVAPALKSGGIEPPAGRRFGIREVLVAGQIAFSMLLLIIAGFAVRDFYFARTLNPGFRIDNALVLVADPSLASYDETRGRSFFERTEKRLSALPGVRSVALLQHVPLGFTSNKLLCTVDGYEMPKDQLSLAIEINAVSANYFRTAGISLVEGRAFDQRDSAAALPVAVVNQTMAARYWPGRSPIGGVLRAEGKAIQVVGVAANMQYRELGEAPLPYFYLPFAQRYSPRMAFQIETSGDPLAAAPSVLAAIREVDPVPAIQDVRTMRNLFTEGGLFSARLMAQLVSGIGLLGLALAVSGLYGVVAYMVSRRTREIGIRIAIGASRADVLTMVLRKGLLITAAGAAVGLALGIAASGLVRQVLVVPNAAGPLIFVLVPLLLGAVSAAACYLPARRAARINPVSALRFD